MMQSWFEDAKLGIFVHWGVYAIQKRGGESWPIVKGEVSYNEYMTQIQEFTASKYDPDSWADLFKRAGARYAVLTTKHHDGVALWPTKAEGPSVCNDGVVKQKDLVEPFLKALDKKGLHRGLYFSHTDWSCMDHWSVICGKDEAELMEMRKKAVNFRELWEEQMKNPGPEIENLAKDEAYQKKWENFLNFHRTQLGELLGNYGDIDLIWFDVMLKRPGFDYKTAEIRDFIHSFSDKTVINSRLAEHGDYETPEQFIPVYPPKGPWELCVTTNNTWSYTGKEEQYKTPYEIITMFTECLGMGGNMLLNVGPDESGIIPQQQVALLETLGKWISKHEEAVYGTVRGLPHGYAYGFTSLNKARDVIYLYLSHIPKEMTLIKGIHNNVKKATILGKGTPCATKRIGGAPWMNVPGSLGIDVPKGDLDEYVTVLKIELDGPLNLYSGEGVEINVN
jgi:alpha-L-fucosidase